MLQTVSITLSGRVQGVFFRHSAREMAIRFGITGEVSNQPDGSVFIIATGTREQLDKLLSWCRQGPPRARVEHMEVKELPFHQFEDFSIIRL
jgi:acylphosphatase